MPPFSCITAGGVARRNNPQCKIGPANQTADIDIFLPSTVPLISIIMVAKQTIGTQSDVMVFATQTFADLYFPGTQRRIQLIKNANKNHSASEFVHGTLRRFDFSYVKAAIS